MMMKRSINNGKEIPYGCTSAYQTNKLGANVPQEKNTLWIIQEKYLEAWKNMKN